LGGKGFFPFGKLRVRITATGRKYQIQDWKGGRVSGIIAG
jgi:hypothetical protein